MPSTRTRGMAARAKGEDAGGRRLNGYEEAKTRGGSFGRAEKYTVEREYGMPARLHGHTIEIDHIVSLELGGSKNIANLFPEPGVGGANYHTKDRLENRLHALVCDGQVTLRAAQAGIASNWKTLYRRVYGAAP